jgi:hypothetical protein
MKKYIVKTLKWALSKFEEQPSGVVHECWPFPVESETVKKPRLKKATTLKIRKAPPKKAK